MIGRCICGRVEFEITKAPKRLYRCHCTLCQKQSGAGSNAAFITQGSNLHWRCDKANVASYKKGSGFSSHFCTGCGCPVPNPVRGSAYYWIPAGLLEPPVSLSVAVHLYINDRADWDTAPLDGKVFETMPSLEDLVELLND
jgi:hypothetical protein